MKKEDFKIIFMGTPQFAVPSLDVLVKNGWNVVAVVTVPDKPAGRGLKITASPVKEYAKAHGLPVLQPQSLKDEEFIQQLKEFQPDLFVVVAFRILPEIVFTIPKYGSFNLHASLLPKYRGAAPVNWAIIRGEKETGVTTFFLKRKVDTGNIISQRKLPIRDTDTMGTLHDRLMEEGAELVLETVETIAAGEVKEKPQDEPEDNFYAPKIFNQDCKVNFNKTAREAYDFIRGMSPWPAAWTMLNGKRLKIFWAEYYEKPHDQSPGNITADPDLKIATQDGFILPREVQLEGKKRMGVDEFLKGYSF